MRECGESETVLAIAMSLLVLLLAGIWCGLVLTGNPR